MTDINAADLPLGAVLLRNGLKATKKYTDSPPWVMRRFGRFDNATATQWIDEGALLASCCDLHGIGDHDPAEHGEAIEAMLREVH